MAVIRRKQTKKKNRKDVTRTKMWLKKFRTKNIKEKAMITRKFEGDKRAKLK